MAVIRYSEVKPKATPKATTTQMPDRVVRYEPPQTVRYSPTQMPDKVVRYTTTTPEINAAGPVYMPGGYTPKTTTVPAPINYERVEPVLRPAVEPIDTSWRNELADPMRYGDKGMYRTAYGYNPETGTYGTFFYPGGVKSPQALVKDPNSGRMVSQWDFVPDEVQSTAPKTSGYYSGYGSYGYSRGGGGGGGGGSGGGSGYADKNSWYSQLVSWNINKPEV